MNLFDIKEDNSFYSDAVLIMYVLHQSYSTILKMSEEERQFFAKCSQEIMKKLHTDPNRK